MDRELALEQVHVDRVFNQLQQAVASAKGLAKESRARYTSDRETWLREEDGTALFERDAFAFLAARRMAVLDGEHEGLVFGRLDFTDEEIRYIGRLGVRTDDYEPLVIDWRASAAEPFYRATPVNPMEVIRRRVLTSRDDRVLGVEDDVLLPEQVPDDMVVIGDGALMKALGRARTAKMHDIVATIQAEQDEAIRAPYGGFTLITGGPGTGKTVVGLHRIAYLLYSYRRRFGNGGVLIVGPSATFMDYIERVLPSLGEDKVVLRSVGQVASDALGLSSSVHDEPAAWAVKGGAHMATVLRRLVESPRDKLASSPVMVKGEPLSISDKELAHIRRDALAHAPYHEARKLAEREVVQFLWHQGEDIVDVETPQQFDELVRSSWAFTQLMESWWPVLDPASALARLADPGTVRRVASDLLTEEEIHALASSINSTEPTLGDIPLLDELAALLGHSGVKSEEEDLFEATPFDEVVTISEILTDTRDLSGETLHNTYAHILVDEAQDITPMQWRMIHRRGPQASWTILGDPAQSNWPDPGEPAQALETLIGTHDRRTFRLSTNYRSPKEAYDLATAYILEHEAQADVPEAVRSTGVEPRLLVAPAKDVADTIRTQVEILLEEVEGTIAVLAEHRHDQDVFEGLLGMDSRVSFMDPVSAKGLEFDAVVVVDPDSIQNASAGGARTLYVALTRPTQVLVCVDVDVEGAWRPQQ
jgi:DNA helicase IV